MIGIFGANGFIGRHMVARLASGPERVRAVSRHIDPAYAASLGSNVEVVQADLADDIAMASALQDVRVVIQLVSTSSPGLENRYAVSDIRDNVLPQVSFLEACVAAKVERYVFLSSGGTVYGQPQTLPIPETHEARPLSSHGMTKLVVEQYIDLYGRLHGLPYVILRVANPFGPGQVFRKGQGLIPALLQRHAQGLPVRIINGGRAIRDFLYIDDLADAVASSLSAPEAVGRTINIGSGEGRRIMDVIEAVEHVLGQRFAREDGGHRSSDVDANVLDITLARRLLDWSPNVPFMDGLERTLRG